jgi:hypothetical protein
MYVFEARCPGTKVPHISNYSATDDRIIFYTCLSYIGSDPVKKSQNNTQPENKAHP